jgi:hypothetical protein
MGFSPIEDADDQAAVHTYGEDRAGADLWEIVSSGIGVFVRKNPPIVKRDGIVADDEFPG